jgi:hypothetical protein
MNEFDRVAKLFVDRGDAADQREALDRLAERPLQLLLGAGVAASETLQIVALLATDLGRRAFPRGVKVVLAQDGPSLANGTHHETLAEALVALPGVSRGDAVEDLPTVCVSWDETLDVTSPAVRAVARGWAGGAVPVFATRVDSRPGVLGAVLAAAISVSEVFCAVHHASPRATLRPTGLSTWAPDVAWNEPAAVGPELAYLPKGLWLLGLGHLGQAYAWLLRALPYEDFGCVSLVVQDPDAAGKENYATQLLTEIHHVGQRKTQIVANALRACGADVAVVDRRFDRHQRRQRDEPAMVLVGLDNDEARRSLSVAGFAQIINVGLGARAETFTAILLQRVEADSKILFADRAADSHAERLVREIPAYRSLADSDRCGALVAAGKAVGVAFVGTAAAAIALAEVLRPLHGGKCSASWQVNLRAPGSGCAGIRETTSADLVACAGARALREPNT